MKKKRLLVLLVVAAAMLWAPRVIWAARERRSVRLTNLSMAQPGAAVPTIHLDAFNDDRGVYCVTCEAARSPAVVAFVSKADAQTAALMSALDEVYQAKREEHLYGSIIIVGEGKDAKALRKYAEEHQFAIPTAQMNPKVDELKLWNLDQGAASSTYFIVGHSVKTRAANLDAAKVPENVQSLFG